MSGRAPWVTHFGLTRTPFSKGIPAKDLFLRKAHAEAVARITLSQDVRNAIHGIAAWPF